MKLITPNYSKRAPIVDDGSFQDSPTSPATSLNTTAGPKLGGPTDSFNPGASSGILPNGPPKYVSPPGRRIQAKGLTNKRLTTSL